MSNINEKINSNNKTEQEIKNMSIKEIFNEIEDRNSKKSESKVWKIIKGIFLFWPKMLGSMFGLDKDTLTSYSKHGPKKGPSDFESHGSHPHPPQAFRESYKKTFNPYDYDVANQMLYYKSIDGAGDIEHCDHDHDEH